MSTSALTWAPPLEIFMVGSRDVWALVYMYFENDSSAVSSNALSIACDVAKYNLQGSTGMTLTSASSVILSFIFIIFLFFVDPAAMSVNIHINSPNVKYTETHIEAQYSYQTTSVHQEGNKLTVSLIIPPAWAHPFSLPSHPAVFLWDL